MYTRFWNYTWFLISDVLIFNVPWAKLRYSQGILAKKQESLQLHGVGMPTQTSYVYDISKACFISGVISCWLHKMSASPLFRWLWNLWEAGTRKEQLGVIRAISRLQRHQLGLPPLWDHPPLFFSGWLLVFSFGGAMRASESVASPFALHRWTACCRCQNYNPVTLSFVYYLIFYSSFTFLFCTLCCCIHRWFVVLVRPG